MAELTFAQAWTPIVNAIALLEEARKFAHVNAAGNISNWVSREDTFIQSLDGDSSYTQAAAAGIAQLRGDIARLLANGRAVLDPLILQLGKSIDAPERDPLTVLTRVYDYMHASGERITSRSFMRGAAVADAGNAGNGSVYRVTVDENGYDLEASFADEITAECIRDENSGAAFQGQEVFEVRGRSFGPDEVDLENASRGSGIVTEIAAKSPDDNIIDNGSFGSLDLSGGSITGWESSVTINTTNFGDITSTAYREVNAEAGTARALEVKTSATLTQRLTDTRKSLSPDTPYFCHVAYNVSAPSPAGAGTLALHLGSQSTTVTVTGKTGWNLLTLPVGQNSWLKNFNQADVAVKLVVTLTAGSIYLDDVMLVPFDAYDGAWILFVGGDTNWLRGDKFTITDTVTGSIIQRWLWRLYGMYLPHTTGTGVTIADPIV